jgi:hypothetical protein
VGVCSNQACADICVAQNTLGATLYDAMLVCIICDVCSNDCGGSEVPQCLQGAAWANRPLFIYSEDVADLTRRLFSAPAVNQERSY